MMQALIFVPLALQLFVSNYALAIESVAGTAQSKADVESKHLPSEVYAVNTGAKFVRDNTFPEHGLAYRDSMGLIWFEPSKELIFDMNAQQHCSQKSGARLPYGDEFLRFRNSFTFDTTVNYGVTSKRNPDPNDKIQLFPLIPVDEWGNLKRELSLTLSNNLDKKQIDAGYLPNYEEMGGKPLWLNLENRNLYGIGKGYYRIFCVKETAASRE